MGKTETIKERAIWVYTPTIETRRQWEEIAKKNNISLSKWIVQTIEDSLIRLDEEVKTRKDIEKENEDLKKGISELEVKLRQDMIIRDNLEKEIKKYRAEPFIPSSFQGFRQFNKELIQILRNAKGVDGKVRYVDNDELLSRLGIKNDEIEPIKSISSQLSNLEAYGIIQSSTKGWRWKE